MFKTVHDGSFGNFSTDFKVTKIAKQQVSIPATIEDMGRQRPSETP